VDEDVRWFVANNSNTPPETLTILARVEERVVRSQAIVTLAKKQTPFKDEIQQKLEELELLKQQARGKIFDL
jgi:hypothetical protein